MVEPRSGRRGQLLRRQEQGNAIADVLFGDVNPSGKLPVTFPRDESQPKQLGIANPWETLGNLEVPFNEGIFVGYRGYDRKRLDPLFPFGHGLSHTRFRYRNLPGSPGRPTVA